MGSIAYHISANGLDTWEVAGCPGGLGASTLGSHDDG